MKDCLDPILFLLLLGIGVGFGILLAMLIEDHYRGKS